MRSHVHKQTHLRHREKVPQPRHRLHRFSQTQIPITRNRQLLPTRTRRPRGASFDGMVVRQFDEC
jgi:hypothetical protein